MAPSGTITLRWLGTAGFHIRHGDLELLLDPYLSREEGARPEIDLSAGEFDGASLILLSHGHFDHAADAADLARLSGAHVYAPAKTCRILEARGVARSVLFANEETSSFDRPGVKVRVIPSRHIKFDAALVVKTLLKVLRGGVFFKLWPLLRGYPLGSNSEFLLDFSGYRVLFSGSGGGDWGALAGLAPDCLLFPFAGRTDVAEICMDAIRALRPKTVVLHHFDEFFPSFCVDYQVDAFRERLAQALPEVSLIIPEAGEAFNLP